MAGAGAAECAVPVRVAQLRADADIMGEAVARADARGFDRGFAAGLAAARARVPRPRRGGTRPLWPRAVS